MDKMTCVALTAAAVGFFSFAGFYAIRQTIIELRKQVNELRAALAACHSSDSQLTSNSIHKTERMSTINRTVASVLSRGEV